MLMSRNLVASTTIDGTDGPPEVSGAVSIGAAQLPTVRGSIWSQDRNVDGSDANMYTSTTDIITLATGPSTVNARADLAYFSADGFTLNWTAADVTARQILYWVIGTNVSDSNILWREVIQ